MLIRPILQERIRLSCLEDDDVDQTSKIVEWLTSSSTNQYLESRFLEHTQTSQELYIREHNSDASSIYLGIYWCSEDKLVGTISANVNKQHQTAKLGIMIGDTAYRGRGVATESIEMLSAFLLESLGLRKITAGIYKSNISSVRAFLRAGFEIEATLRDEVCFNDSDFDDVLILSRFK